jgi:urea transport system permease protein
VLATFIGFAYQFADSFAFLILSSIGLAVIFGMMGVINLAHGEFIMCGAYVTVLSARAGLPLPLAMLLGAAVAGVIGMLIEYVVIRRLYGRLFDSIVATWAISLIATQGMLIVAGPSIEGLKTPFGSFELAGLSFSWYRVLLPVVALAILAGLYLLFVKTPFGVRARATIQKPDMARALGVDTDRVYALTFGLGAALAGLTGALYAPTMTTVPTMGSAFIVQAFVTVVVGGTDVLLGAAPAAAVLAFIQSLLTASYGQLMGQVGLLLTVIVVVRVLPKGVSGWMLKGSE